MASYHGGTTADPVSGPRPAGHAALAAIMRQRLDRSRPACCRPAGKTAVRSYADPQWPAGTKIRHKMTDTHAGICHVYGEPGRAIRDIPPTSFTNGSSPICPSPADQQRPRSYRSSDL